MSDDALLGEQDTLASPSMSESSAIIPKEWIAAKLEDVVNIAYGIQAAVANQNDCSKGLPILTNINIRNDGVLDLSIQHYYNLKSNNKDKILAKGDILFNWRSGSKSHVGKTAVFSLDGQYTFSSFILRFRTNDKIINYFLFFYLNFLKNRHFFATQANVSSVNAVFNASISAKIPIYVPPMYEQKKIVYVLSIIQTMKEKTDNVLKTLIELKKSLMKHLFTYGAVSLGDAESISLKDSEIGKLNEEWEVVRLDEMAEITMGQSPKGETYNTIGNGVPLINGPTEYGPRNPRIVQWTTTPTKLCQKGDIFFCVRGNTLGRLNISDAVFCIGRGIAAIRGIDNISDTTFLYYFLEMKVAEIYGKCVGVNSTFPNISGASMKKIRVSKPPLPIQKHIAQILGTVDSKIESEQTKKKALGELFQSMLLNLMTAKIRVNDLEL